MKKKKIITRISSRTGKSILTWKILNMPLTIKLLHNILSDFGYIIVSQKGSHIKYRKDDATIMAPNHKELKTGTGSTILKDICNQNSLSYQELIKKYQIKL